LKLVFGHLLSTFSQLQIKTPRIRARFDAELRVFDANRVLRPWNIEA